MKFHSSIACRVPLSRLVRIVAKAVSGGSCDKRRAALAIVFLSALWSVGHAAELNSIAFGSCNHSHLRQPMWSVIDSHQPALFIWTGDVVYADTTSVVKMKRKYQQQLSRPAYKEFREKFPVIGIWDDHDFGINNGGRRNPIKAEGQQMFLDFLDEPQDSKRREQEGIYAAYTYGHGQRSVKVILLDTRYHRDRPGSGRADMLGREQWLWLENEIKSSTATVNIIVSGVSVLSRQIPFAEEWNDFKWARMRLFKLIEQHQLPGVLFLTGDRHFSSHLKETVNGQDYHEFMSSGLTHYMNRKRVAQIFKYYYGEEYSYFGLNFSLLDFHWDRKPIQLTFRVFDQENVKRVEKTLSLIDRDWTD